MGTFKCEKTRGLFLQALDVLFFRDGRPFGRGDQAQGGLPTPQTLSGAIRTKLLAESGFDFNRFSAKLHEQKPGDYQGFKDVLLSCGAAQNIVDARIRGPWLAMRKKASELDVFIPAPADLVRDVGDQLHRLRPQKEKLPGWQADTDYTCRYPLWFKKAGKIKPEDGYINLKGLSRYLQGGVPEPEEIRDAASLYGFQTRTGIGINPESMTVDEGLIYSIDVLALKKDVGFYAEVCMDGDARLDGPMPFGGQGRHVSVSGVEPVCWPVASKTEAPQHGDLLLLITPGVFNKGWMPDLLDAKDIISAGVPSPLSVSGWDVCRHGPKPTRFAVRAGSVYFLDGDANLESYSLCSEDEFQSQGYGHFLKGVWNYD